ncbi:hypothetical protein HAX54_032737 [Datura stramonium]|uniref:NB-ARC domain-containing protein n=1 Tax=Datura stramonium TaxID=4076 RepID=A0ABS8SCU0_DATST|nr:hypothetical protein [Datura stramonium]
MAQECRAVIGSIDLVKGRQLDSSMINHLDDARDQLECVALFLMKLRSMLKSSNTSSSGYPKMDLVLMRFHEYLLDNLLLKDETVLSFTVADEVKKFYYGLLLLILMNCMMSKCMGRHFNKLAQICGYCYGSFMEGRSIEETGLLLSDFPPQIESVKYRDMHQELKDLVKHVQDIKYVCFFSIRDYPPAWYYRLYLSDVEQLLKFVEAEKLNKGDEVYSLTTVTAMAYKACDLLIAMKRRCELADEMRRFLLTKRFLILIDDVWDTHICASKMLRMGVETILTTRLKECRHYAKCGKSTPLIFAIRR